MREGPAKQSWWGGEAGGAGPEPGGAAASEPRVVLCGAGRMSMLGARCPLQRSALALPVGRNPRADFDSAVWAMGRDQMPTSLELRSTEQH